MLPVTHAKITALLWSGVQEQAFTFDMPMSPLSLLATKPPLPGRHKMILLLLSYVGVSDSLLLSVLTLVNLVATGCHS